MMSEHASDEFRGPFLTASQRGLAARLHGGDGEGTRQHSNRNLPSLLEREAANVASKIVAVRSGGV